MYTALVLDQYALSLLGSAAIENGWFEKFSLPEESGLKRIEIEGVCYILSSRADEKSRLLVINAEKNGVFARAASPRHVFERIIHVALAQFEREISIPVKWRSFQEGQLLSVYAQPEAVGPRQRVYFDRGPDGLSHLYVYALTDKVEDFANVQLDMEPLRQGLDHYLDAVIAPPPAKTKEHAYGIVLTEPLGTTLVGGFTLSEWYNRKLTQQQRRFVDHDHKTPVRLKGAAGTGKTLSMAVKCLLDLYKCEDAGRDARVAFLTHSVALAQDVLPGMFMGLDPSLRWTELKELSSFSRFNL